VKKNNKKVNTVPEYRTVTEFLKGQASKIFEEIVEQDEVIIVNKHGKPHCVAISYERYKKLKDEGVDI
jgi:prevent-host-death family protein